MILMHISHIFDEQLPHVFFNFVYSVELFTTWALDYHGSDLKAVKCRTDVVESLVYLVVVEVETLESSVIPQF